MIISNIIDSWKHIPYTLRHYIAFLKTEKKYIGYYKYKFHDLDKVLMYIIIPWLGTKRIKKIHRAINKHQNHKAAYECNYEEAVIDWECCRLTKPNECKGVFRVQERHSQRCTLCPYGHGDETI